MDYCRGHLQIFKLQCIFLVHMIVYDRNTFGIGFRPKFGQFSRISVWPKLENVYRFRFRYRPKQNSISVACRNTVKPLKGQEKGPICTLGRLEIQQNTMYIVYTIQIVKPGLKPLKISVNIF